MKYQIFFNKTLLFIFCILLLSQCRKKCVPPIDPCLDEVETTADFEFLIRTPGTDSIYWTPAADTFYNGLNGSGAKLYFKAKSDKMDAYSWKVGTDPSTFTDSLFFLNFAGIDGRIDVTLTTNQNNVKEECFPNDIGIATKTRSIEMKTFSLNTDLPIYGKYEGAYDDSPNTIFQIEIKLSNTNVDIVDNFPYQCNASSIMKILLTGGGSFIYDDKNLYQCGDPSGGGWLEPGNQTLIIEYTVDDPNDPTKRIFKRFTGQRI